jgi:hypothetical protein
MGKRKWIDLPICRHCGSRIETGHGLPRRNIHYSCLKEMPYDLKIRRKSGAYIEVHSFLLSDRLLKKLIRVWSK